MSNSNALRMIVLSTLVWGLPVLGAGAPDIESLMTPEEFAAAGIDRLSPAEREALNRWLIRYTAQEAPVMRTSSEAVREEIRKSDAKVIHSRIVGEFTGWTGRTVFRLENGQVWRQRRDESFYYRASQPEVEISKNVMGFWQMRVQGANRAVGVSRIE